MSGEFTPVEDTRRGYFAIRPEKKPVLKRKELEFGIVDGLALFEGDIILGTEERIAAMVPPPPLPEVGTPAGERPVLVPKGVVAPRQFLWPGGSVPYTIDPGLLHPEFVRAALDHWEKYTVIRFVPRHDEPDYVTFVPAGASRSYVGRQGGQQIVQLAPVFSPGTVIHEVGHTLGLWHEQSREDRDEHVAIHWENILPNCEHNFTQRVADGDDVGPYDYDSIMHYPSFAFSRNNLDTITPCQPGVAIGQRNGLSLGDIDAVNGLYGQGELYVGNTRSKAFHNRGCPWVDRMAETNTRYFTALDQALAAGYRACRTCFPPRP